MANGAWIKVVLVLQVAEAKRAARLADTAVKAGVKVAVMARTVNEAPTRCVLAFVAQAVAVNLVRASRVSVTGPVRAGPSPRP